MATDHSGHSGHIKREIPADFALDEMGRVKWDEVWAELDQRSMSPAPDLVAMYCIYFSEWTAASTKVRQQGAVVKNEKGQIMLSPYVEVRDSAFQHLERLSSDLGLRASVGELPWAAHNPIEGE